MSAIRRILAVATLRAREGLRGPLAWFLVLFLAASAAGMLLVPGEPGLEHQRAVDGLVLDLGLLFTVLAAASIGAASLAGDREAGRESLLRAGALRPVELMAGGFLGQAASLAVLTVGVFLGTISLTGLLAGGDGDRTPTRVLLRAEHLLDANGDEVTDRLLALTRRVPAATYVFDAPRSALAEEPETTVRVVVVEMIDDMQAGLPQTYPVGVRVDEGPERILTLRTGNPIVIDVRRTEFREEGGTRFTIRRIDPAYTLTLLPTGFHVEGRTRSFTANLAKAFGAWFLALLIVAAAGQALSTVVGAPVAAAGAIFLGLLGRSLGVFEEALAHASRVPDALAPGLEFVARATIRVTPDFDAFDLTEPVTARWDIDPALLADRLRNGLPGIVVLLAAALLLLALGRRR